MCRTVVEVDDVEAARTALAAVDGEAAELTGRPGAQLHAEHEAFHLTVEAPNGNTIIGIVRLGAGELELEANSVARIEALQALVLERVPGGTIVEDERVPVQDMLGDHLAAEDEPAFGESGTALAGGGLGPGGDGGLDDLDPDQRAEMLEALDAWMADAEDRWVDEQIPALDNLTPREAAADPTRRGDLEALLDEFPAADAVPGPGRGMDPDRLRRLLGLDT